MQPLIAGGGHERGLRSGTENVAAIVGFGLAAESATRHLDRRRRVLAALRSELETGLEHLGATIFAAAAPRLPNTSYFAFAGVDGETLVGRLDRAGIRGGGGSRLFQRQSGAIPRAAGDGREPGARPRRRAGEPGIRQQSAQVRDFLGILNTTILQLKGLSALVG